MPQALVGVFSLILPLHPHCISELALQVRELYHKEVNKWPKVTEPGEGEAGAWIQGFVQLKQAPILSCCLSEVLPPRSVWCGSQMPGRSISTPSLFGAWQSRTELLEAQPGGSEKRNSQECRFWPRGCKGSVPRSAAV